MTAAEDDIQIAELMAKTYDDPLLFVRTAYPWGEPGPLREYAGPDIWQAEFLRDLGRQVRERKFNGHSPVAPIRCAVASGNGVGKGVMSAWLVDWIMSTRPNCRGTVTANTYPQLQTKTWATIQTWTERCITSGWFTVTNDAIKAKVAPANWFCSAQTCRAENSESFAGQHAADSTSFYILDECSAIDEKIFEVSEWGLTDGEPMIFLFGNPTRKNGQFHRVVFGSDRHRWNSMSIDSRQSQFTNKAEIAQQIEERGIDSDFIRVHVLGLAPNASDLQFIDSQRVYDAQRREAVCLDNDPLIVGLDLARGGEDKCVFRFRRGNDARSIPPVKIPGEQSRDSARVVTTAAEILTRQYGGQRVAVMFVDESGGSVGGPIGDQLRRLGHQNVIGVQFGGKPPDQHYANMRAWMWAKMRQWLERGAIDKDVALETDLCGPEYHSDKQDRLVLEAKEEMKRRGLASPDDGDSLALTFAQAVAPVNEAAVRARSYGFRLQPGAENSWMA